MKFFRIIKCDLNKTIVNVGFWGASIMTFVLCFTAYAYIDPQTDRTYSVFEAIFTLDRSLIKSEYTFSNIFIFGKSLSGYITMFIPIIAAFPFMVTFCAERNSGLMRFAITRTGKIKYYLSKFSACFIGGGLAVFLGTALFGLIAKIVFPDISAYDIDPEFLKIRFPNGISKYCISVLISAFMYGAVSVMPAFFLSSFCRNPYLITCIPFLLVYVGDTTINKITIKLFESGRFGDIEKLNSFKPDSIMRIVFSGSASGCQRELIFNSCYIIILLFFFVFIMNRRRDKGV